jgi:hypothetical protein
MFKKAWPKYRNKEEHDKDAEAKALKVNLNPSPPKLADFKNEHLRWSNSYASYRRVVQAEDGRQLLEREIDSRFNKIASERK